MIAWALTCHGPQDRADQRGLAAPIRSLEDQTFTVKLYGKHRSIEGVATEALRLDSLQSPGTR